MNETETDPARSLFPSRATLSEIVTDAIRYWEPRRILYNVVLGLIVIGYFVAYWPASREIFSVETGLGMFMLVVLANLCYCSAYLVDLFAQISDFRGLWRRWRWMLLATGIAFAAIITRHFAMGMFSALELMHEMTRHG